MTKRMIIMLISVGIFFGIIFGWWGIRFFLMKMHFEHFKPPPVTISSATSVAKIWQERLPSTGSLTAINGVDITSEASGLVKQIYFKSGTFIKNGDLLVHLDTSVEEADLANYIAQLKLAKITYDRDKDLVARNAISKSALDKSTAQLGQMQAQVDRVKALISQKYIRAPFDGKIGIRKVNLGEYISAGKALVALQSLDPLYVDFSLPQQNLRQIDKGQVVEIKIDAFPDKIFFGKITSINAKISESTRTIQIRATLPNKEHLLYPGMFVMVQVVLPSKKNVVIIPQTAIAYSLYGNSVFVIEKEKQTEKDKINGGLIVIRRFVKIGERRGDVVSILQGLKAGERVVSSGQLKLDNKTPVVINNSVEF